jgi:hypothetical protein
MGEMQKNTVAKTENTVSLSPADVLGALNDVEEKHAPKQLFVPVIELSSNEVRGSRWSGRARRRRRVFDGRNR